MKAQKKLNIILLILVILLISIISFVGIFYQSKNQMINLLPNYKLGTNLKGYRRVTLELKDSSNTDTNTTSETTSNETTSNETNTSTDSSDETSDNYKKCADIIKKRLKKLNVEDYTVSCDANTGRIDISLPDNDQTDSILADITQKGSFEIIDTTTKEVLLNNEDIKNVEIKTSTSGSTTSINMNINFNLNGTSKFTKITKEYQNTATANATSNETNTADNTTNTADNTTNTANNTTNSTDNTTNTTEEANAEPVKTQVTLKIDDNEMMTTYFTEIVDSGTLALTVNSSSTTDTSTFKEKMYGAYNLAAIIENDAMPLQYEIKSNTYVEAPVNGNGLNLIIYIEIGIALVISLAMIIKYRLNGVISTITSMGFIAILLLTLRYANVSLSIEGIFAIEITFIINMIYNFIYCSEYSNDMNKKEKQKLFKDSIKKFVLTEIPILILAIIGALTEWSTLFSFGMVLFWGMLISTLYNIIVNYILMTSMNK